MRLCAVCIVDMSPCPPNSEVAKVRYADVVHPSSEYMYDASARLITGFLPHSTTYEPDAVNVCGPTLDSAAYSKFPPRPRGAVDAWM